MKTINQAVVRRLLKYMEEKNLTQYKLAELSNLPYSTIKSIMQKKSKNINLKTIIHLSYGLNMKPCEFIDDNSFLYENLDLE